MLSTSAAKTAKPAQRAPKGHADRRAEGKAKMEKRPNGNAFGGFLGAAP